MSAAAGAQERMLAELERLKTHAGLSFAQLQATIPYSRSALHRYFTGQSAIPRDAIVAVVRACGGDEAAMVRMWEATQSEQVSRQGATSAPVGPVGPAGPGPGPRPARLVSPVAAATRAA